MNRRKLPLLLLLALFCTGCTGGLTGNKSMFGSSAPGANGPLSEEEIEARAAKDPWQPNSQFTVTTPGTVTR